MRRSFLSWIAFKRPVTASMALLACLPLGLLSYFGIHLQLIPPGISEPFLIIWISYPRSSPVEVLNEITKPTEDMLSTIKGVSSMTSISSSDGAKIDMRFKPDTHMDTAYLAVQDRLDRLRAELPDDIETIRTYRYNPDAQPIIWMGIQSQGDISQAYDLLQNVLVRQIQNIDGVALARLNGISDATISIRPDPEKLEKYKLDTASLIMAIQSNNFRSSVGSIRSHRGLLHIRVISDIQHVDEIRAIPVTGTHITVGDVAEVRRIHPKTEQRYLIEGIDSITLDIFKESKSNTIEICSKVEKVLQDLFRRDPRLAGFQYHIFFSQGAFIRTSLNDIVSSGKWGGVLALLVLFLALRRLGMTCMIILATPLSLLITVIAMYFMNRTLNVASMMGFMISIGMLLDNSIVVAESIHACRNKGMPLAQAIQHGSLEVETPILVSTLTTMAVFVPVMFLSSGTSAQVYMVELGLPVCLSLLASLGVALVFIPLVSRLLLSRSTPISAMSHGTAGRYHAMLAGTRAIYISLLRRILDHRLVSVVGLCVCAAALLTVWRRHPVAKTDDSFLSQMFMTITYRGSPQSTWESTDKIFQHLNALIQANRRDLEITSSYAHYRAQWGHLHLFSMASDNTLTKANQRMKTLRKLLPEIPGAKLSIKRETNTAGRRQLGVVVSGPDYVRLQNIVDRLAHALQQHPDVVGIDTGMRDLNNELHVIVNRDLAREHGSTPANIAKTIAQTYREITFGRYHAMHRDIDMKMELSEQHREGIHRLQTLHIPRGSGDGLLLETVADVQKEWGRSEIRRVDKETQYFVSIETRLSNLQAFKAAIQPTLERFPMPAGYRLSFGERFDKMKEMQHNMITALLLSVCLVFLLIGILLESWLLPLTILGSIPPAIAGGYALLWCTHTPLDQMAWIGMVVLVGLVVNNAIVFVDRIQRLRQQGPDRRTAILEAANQRIRPIALTSATTVAGLLPLATGFGASGGIPYTSLAITIMGGLIASTMFTLLLVPLLYCLLDDLRRYFLGIPTSVA